MPTRKDQQSISEAARIFFQVSDPEVLGKVAGGDSSGSDWQVTSQGTMVNRKTGEERVLDEFQRQRQSVFDWREKQANRAIQARAAQFGMGQQFKEQEKARAPEKVFQQSQDSLRLADKADMVASQLQDMMNRGQGPKSFVGETAMQAAGDFAGGAVRKGIEKMTFDEGERNLRAMMADLSTAIDQAKMKGVLSDQDLQRLQAASFNEPGIEDTEALARLRMASDILRTSSQSSMAGRQAPAGARPMANLSGDNMPQGPASVRATTVPVPAEVSDEELTRQYEALQRWNAQRAR